MTNIPTELLRALVTVVDLHSFTKAATKLGVTQPAVSAQIKRLQILLGGDLFCQHHSVQGVSLTPQGEIVVNHARRLLSVNDQIVQIGLSGPRPEQLIRVGVQSDFIAAMLPDTLKQFRERWPAVRFTVRTDFYEPLLRQLRSGDIDVAIGLSMEPPRDARHSLAQEVVWVHSAATQIKSDWPVPLVSYGESCVYHRLTVAKLKSGGFDWEDVFIGSSFASLRSAVNAGLGVMALTRRRAIGAGMTVWEETPLPKLPELYAGVYIREGGGHIAYEQLADEFASHLWTR